MAGFNDELKKYPDMKIVADQSAAFDRKKGHDVFQTILQGQPKIDGVFGVNDEMAIGAAQAAVEAHRREGISFWGADGELDMFKGSRAACRRRLGDCRQRGSRYRDVPRRVADDRGHQRW